MTFTPEQVTALQAPLSRAHVRQRSQAGRSLSYIEGWRAIDEANRIFGFDAWDRETVELRELGEPRQVQDKWRVAYMARVRITVRCGREAPLDEPYSITTRDGCGYGSGIDRDLGSAHESALKEAETDAMKRALMTFGNPFGLALYDKDQAQVSDDARPNGAEPPAGPVKSSRQAKKDGDWDQIEAGIASCRDTAALLDWVSLVQAPLQRLSPAWQAEAREAWAKALASKLVEECHQPSEVRQWGVDYAAGIEAMPMEWINTARQVCSEHVRALKAAQPVEVMA